MLTTVGLHPNVIDAAENYVPPVRKHVECLICGLSSDYIRSFHAGLQDRNPANCDSMHKNGIWTCGSLGKEACCALYRAVLTDWLNKKVDCRQYEYMTCRFIENSECEEIIHVDCIQLDYEDFQKKANDENYCLMTEGKCSEPYPIWCFPEEPCYSPPGEPPGTGQCELYCTKHPKTGEELLRCACPYKDEPPA